MVTIFGNDMGPDSLTGLALDGNGRVSSLLDGVRVLFDGLPAPLIYVSKNQIAAVAPYELTGRQETAVQVEWRAQKSKAVSLPVLVASPAIFTADSSGSGPGAILNSDGSVNGPSQPAARGDVVVLYLTGEGQTVPAGVSGKVTSASPEPPLTPGPILPVSVRIDGQGADFTFAGEAPTFVSGVLQVNVVIPVTVSAGELPIVVSVGSYATQTGVTVSVK